MRVFCCSDVPLFHNDPKIDNPIIASKDNKFYEELGSLIFYDSKTKAAYILNVWYSFSFPDEDYSGYRFFYIGNDKTIKIFETEGGQNGWSFEATQEINVLADGKIVIKNLN